MEKVDLYAQNEMMRLTALYSLGINGGDRFVIFERLVRIAADFFCVPMVAITLIDEGRQMYFARVGVDADESPRSDSICTHTIADERMLVIRDLTVHPRWGYRSFKAGEIGLRFYAGTPIHVGGQPVGTFCLLDTQPRPFFDEMDEQLLRGLALIAEDLLSLLRIRRDFERLPSHHPWLGKTCSCVPRASATP